MKLALFLFAVSTAHLAHAAVVPADLEDVVRTTDGAAKTYPRFMQMPDPEGNLHMVDLEAEPSMDMAEIERNARNNEYLLFTRSNRLISQTLTLNNALSVTRSNFNANRPTIVVVHGWMSSRYTEPNPTVRTAFLDKSDVNVIVVCWRLLAAMEYFTAARGVPAIGVGVGQFLQFLNSVTGAPFDQMHLVGFSLGAHVVGSAGRTLGGRVARITGLDPAGPNWTYNSDRLKPSDGIYVEAIHTDGSLTGLGIGTSIADVDFFPNGGNSQPGCLTSLCNHNRAWELFGASVTYNHLIGNRCTTNTQITLNTCRGTQLALGNDDLRKTGSGMYRLDTDRRYPY